ncbi:VIT family protein [soil metagenome]
MRSDKPSEKNTKVPSAITHPEHHLPGHQARLNWLRAGVLGADDGIVSVSGLVIGVASATTHSGVILTAGLAGIIAGAISMAAGEYVSVNSQRDSEEALLEKEKYELKHFPKEELDELTGLYEAKGLSKKTARLVAEELSKGDPYKAHIDAELGIDPDNLSNAWHAAGASAFAFLLGSIIPMLAILLPPEGLRIPITFVSVLITLAITGVISARLGRASVTRAVIRVVAGGAIAMVVTYSIGRLFGVEGI